MVVWQAPADIPEEVHGRSCLPKAQAMHSLYINCTYRACHSANVVDIVDIKCTTTLIPPRSSCRFVRTLVGVETHHRGGEVGGACAVGRADHSARNIADVCASCENVQCSTSLAHLSYMPLDRPRTGLRGFTVERLSSVLVGMFAIRGHAHKN